MPETHIDIPFIVPFVHRLRVTDDVCQGDFGCLADLLVSEGANPGKVLVAAETALAEAAGKIASKLESLEAVQLVGEPVIMDGGEKIKNTPHAVSELLAAVNQADLDRRSYIVAIGGGALLDAAGLAAATAHRGIRLIRLPTTTLAQADSGVGVKNAINFFGKKNWLGAFAVPWAVVNDYRLLDTLSDRDFRCGFSEAIKVTLLKDAQAFQRLCDHADRIRTRDAYVAKNAIHNSCQLHLRHITEGGDPFEMLEARPLDFGHWSAHRLEPLSHYELRHGEAVGIGVAIDTIYSGLKFGFPQADVDRVCDALQRLGLPLWHESLLPFDRLLQGLEEFRQHLGGRLTVTMLRKVGEPINVHEIDSEAMIQAIENLRCRAGA